jgi:hypothetical protein
MKYFTIVIVLFAVLLSSCTNYEGNNAVSIKNNHFDFGIVEDTVKTLKHCFYVSNYSKQVCYITKIHRSCGCFTVFVNDKVMQPNDSIPIEIEINTKGQGAYIDKSAEVYVSNSKKPIEISVKAQIKVPDSLMLQQFPTMVSETVYASSSIIMFGYISQGSMKSNKISLINIGKDTVHIKAKLFGTNNGYLYYDEELPPHTPKEVFVTLDFSDGFNTWGKVDYFLILTCNNDTISIPIKGIVIEEFQKNNSFRPKVQLDATTYTLTETDKQLDRIRKAFCISNEGNSDLNIRSIKIEPGSLDYRLDKTVIKPQEYSILYVEFDKTELDSNDIKIEIVCNDKNRPYIELKIQKDIKTPHPLIVN